MDLNKLANIADKVMEVATPTDAAISDTRTNTSELKQICEEVACQADPGHLWQLDFIVEVHPDHVVHTAQSHWTPSCRLSLLVPCQV